MQIDNALFLCCSLFCLSYIHSKDSHFHQLDIFSLIKNYAINFQSHSSRGMLLSLAGPWQNYFSFCINLSTSLDQTFQDMHSVEKALLWMHSLSWEVVNACWYFLEFSKIWKSLVKSNGPKTCFPLKSQFAPWFYLKRLFQVKRYGGLWRQSDISLSGWLGLVVFQSSGWLSFVKM